MAVCRRCWRNKRIEQSYRSALPFDLPLPVGDMED